MTGLQVRMNWLYRFCMISTPSSIRLATLARLRTLSCSISNGQSKDKTIDGAHVVDSKSFAGSAARGIYPTSLPISF
jgi:hypothetical protein